MSHTLAFKWIILFLENLRPVLLCFCNAAAANMGSEAQVGDVNENQKEKGFVVRPWKAADAVNSISASDDPPHSS